MESTAHRRRARVRALACFAVAAMIAGCAPPSGSSSASRSADPALCDALLAEAHDLARDDGADRARLEWTLDELSYRCEREFSALVEEFSRATSAQAQPDTAEVPESEPHGSIPWSEAINHVGTEKYVCGPLVNTGTSDDDVFLNLGRGYPEVGRFTIVLWDVGRIESLPNNVTICATGTVSLYEGTAQIELGSTSAVEIWE